MPIPMPITDAWTLQDPPPLDEAWRARHRPSPGLVAAVAAIVAIAVDRARAAGELAALRDALDAVLDAVSPAPADPAEEDTPDLPCIADADPKQEEARLRLLMARGQPG